MSKFIKPRVAVFLAAAFALIVIGISFAASRSSRLFSVDPNATELAMNGQSGRPSDDKHLSHVKTFYEAIAKRNAAGNRAAAEGESLIASSMDEDNAISDASEPEAEKDVEHLLDQEAFWLNRLTYPTGRFDPEWVRQAAQADSNMERSVPDGQPVQLDRGQGSPLALSTTSFTALGPQPERMTGCTGCFDYGTTAGRVNAIAVDPTTTNNGAITAYLATVDGGIAKTTTCCTAATSWSLITDDPLISTTSIDTLAIDPNHHNTVYAGTGDLNFGSFSMGSQGILKTTNGGASWTVLGANVFGAAYIEPAGQFPQYDAVGEVRVDPNNSNRVVAGTKKGIFISYDAGNNWTGPCTTNSFTTQRQDTTALELSNMGGGLTRILVGIGTRGFATPVQYDLGAQGANGLYKGTLPASGCPGDFTLITRNDNGFVFGTAVTGSPYTTGQALNAGTGAPFVDVNTGNQLSRMEIAVAPSNPNYIYVQVGSIAANNNAGCGNTSGCQLGVWSSIDGGVTWTFMTGSAGGSLRNCTGGNTSGNPGDYPQNWYNEGMAVDPNNPDRLMIDTYDTWFATRTGTSFFNLTCGYNGSPVGNHVVHVDHHALAFVSGSSSLLLEGSDGGIFAATNADTINSTTRPTWFNMDNGLPTIEFYAGDISANFATDAAPAVVGGAQDNGPSSATFPGTPGGPAQWQMGLGGDGFSGQINSGGTGPSQAAGTITLTTGGAVAGETFMVGGQTFTFQTAARTGVGQVTLNTSTTTEGNNIVAAINADIPLVATASRSGATVIVTASVAGAGGNSIVFTENATNMTMNGGGVLGGTTQGGLPGTTQPVFWEGNNSGGLSRCTNNCTQPGASWTSRQGGWTADQQSFVLPINLFHGGVPGGDDCPMGCGHLLAGSTRVWETITGNQNAFWYSTNDASCTGGTNPCLTKGTLGNRSYINQVKYSPKYQSVAIVGTNDGNVQIGFNLGTGVPNQGVWVNVTGGNTVLPNRPILGIALDPSVPAANVPVGYAAVGGFNANTPSTPGHVFQVSCGAGCGAFTWLDKSGNLPDIPVDSIINNPNFPQQVFAGTDFGLYFTNDITTASPTWYRFSNGLPAVMIWDMQIDRGSTTLSLWTRGRGAFVWPLPLGPAVTPSPTGTIPPPPFCPDVTTPFLTSHTGPSGVPVTIPVNTTDVTGRGVIATDFTFTYNPSVLSSAPGDISITPGSTSPAATVTYNLVAPGTIVISVFNPFGFTGAGTLADLHMKVIGPIGSMSPLGLSNFTYNGNTVCSTTSSGTLTIVGGTVTGRVLFENQPFPISTVSPTPTPKPVPNAMLNAVGGSSFFQLSDPNGFYTLSGFGPGPYTVTASRPDENMMAPNGIFSNDASLVAQHVVGLITLNTVQRRAADVSGLHSLSSYDAALIAQWVVGIVNPVNLTGKWVFTPTTTTPDTNIDSVQNYVALLMGDVNADWSPTLFTGPESVILPDSNSIQVSVPKSKAPHDSVVTVPVSLNNLRGRGITAYQFDVQYDPAVVTPAAVAADLSGTICDGFGLAAHSPEPGLLKVAVYGVAPVSSDGIYVNLRFAATGMIGSKTVLTISTFRLDDGTEPVRINNGLIQVTRAIRVGNETVDSPETPTRSVSENVPGVLDKNSALDLWSLSLISTYSLKGV